MEPQHENRFTIMTTLFMSLPISAPMRLERHLSRRISWLRAAVLGADDGIVSTASLIVGVAAAHSSLHLVLLTGTAGLVAGAMSMAAGEYVSVSSQADTEKADLSRERKELSTDIESEREELAQIYEKRGLAPALATEVAVQLMAFDALGAHAREELGIIEGLTAKPLQAALASAATFSIGAALPLLVVLLAPPQTLIGLTSVTSILFLSLLGFFAAKVGGANPWKGALRVGFWGASAMGVTALIGTLFGTSA
jgi:VIT1/CCC1 family predicted Fe2+/Mn2+ transporter